MTISFVNFGTRNSVASATSRTNGSPVAGIAAGDALLSLCCVHNTDTITPTIWTPLTQWAGTGMTTLGVWKISDGTETTGPTFNWTNAAAAFTLMLAWRSTVGFAATPFVVKNANSGTGATHSVTGFNASQAGSWAIYLDQALANTALAAPAGWTEDRDGGSATSVDRDTAGHKALTNAGDASGNISVTGANANWLMQMAELLEVSAKAAPPRQKRTTYIWRR